MSDRLPGSPASWLRSYDRSWLKPDILGAATVWALLVPQALAYSQLAGLPAVYGLYAALGALVLYPLFGSSRHLNVGPEATVATLTAVILFPLAGGDPERYLALAGVLSLMVAAILALGGFLKLGFVTRFLSSPVLIGYIAGSGLVIVLGQLDDLFGLDIDTSEYFSAIGAVFRNFDQISTADAVMGLATIVLLLILRRFVPKWPNYLIVVALGIAVTAIWAPDVAVVGSIEGGLPVPAFGPIELGDIGSLIGPAIAVAVLVFADSVTTVEAVAAKEGYEVNPNHEFYGLAVANVGSGILQGFPVNGSQSRSFGLAGAGGRSQMANWTVALLVVLTLLFLTGLFEDLPDSVLAGIVIVVGASLVDVAAFRRLWRLHKSDFVLSLITAVAVVVAGMLVGILIAVLISLLDVARRAMSPHRAVLMRVPGTDRYRDQDVVEGGELVPGLLVYRFDAPIFFANADVIADDIHRLVADADQLIVSVLFDAEAITDVDVTGQEKLRDLIEELQTMGTTVGVARLRHDVSENLERADMLELFDGGIYLEVDDGVDSFIDSRRDSGAGE